MNVCYYDPMNNYYWAKRLLDIAVILLLSPVIILLFALISLAIKLDSFGPVFFDQIRLGRSGKTFTMYKFRTMQLDAFMFRPLLQARNEADGFLFKMKADPRITRFGRIIRATGLDELPQIINVLKGEMSLVGPRPLPIDDIRQGVLEHDAELSDLWEKRQEALPGITGWWQMKARHRLSFREMVTLDNEYINQASLWFDLRIIGLTLISILRGVVGK